MPPPPPPRPSCRGPERVAPHSQPSPHPLNTAGSGRTILYGPTRFGEPYNKRLLAVGVPFSTDRDQFQATLSRLQHDIETAVGISQPVIATMSRCGSPKPSIRNPASQVTLVRIEFVSVWFQRAALTRQKPLQHHHITLVEDVPRSLLRVRDHQRNLLQQLPQNSRPARVFGVDYYYLPPRGNADPTQPPSTSRGPWVWAPTFQHLLRAVGPQAQQQRAPQPTPRANSTPDRAAAPAQVPAPTPQGQPAATPSSNQPAPHHHAGGSRPVNVCEERGHPERRSQHVAGNRFTGRTSSSANGSNVGTGVRRPF